MTTRKTGHRSVRKSRYDKEHLSKEMFCGPSGGASPKSYPVNTPKRAVAALSYARYAPNPEGIKQCARRVAREHGWLDDASGSIRLPLRPVPTPRRNPRRKCRTCPREKYA